MGLLVWGMIFTGLVVLVAGLGLARVRLAAASGAGKLLVVGPVFEAVALAMFAAEHFLDARELAVIVPRWMPGSLFWTYLVGVALLAAAMSFIAWRCVQWSACLLALLFLIIVVTVDLQGMSKHLHERLFWTLTVREMSFAGGAMVLAGSVWARGRMAAALMTVGRVVVACVFLFYAVEHFLYPRFVPGVPLEKAMPEWVGAPVVLSYVVGMTLLVAGVGLVMARTRRIAAAGAGMMLLLLAMFFYVPILVMEIHTSLALEGVNYVGDTLLFGATALLAGLGQAERFEERVE